MTEYNFRKLQLNKPQLNKVFNPAKQSVDIWSRATGKSFIMGWDIKEAIRQMPRGTFLIYGSTYIDTLTNTLPTTLAALDRLGFVEGVHYVKNVKPNPRLKWDKPFQPVLSYKHTLSFSNGTVFILGSQDRTKRGSNFDGILTDEGLLIKQDRFEQDVIPTNRGNLDRWPKCRIHHFVKIYSSMPLNAEGNWLLEQGKYYDELGYNHRFLKTQLVDTELSFVKSNDKEERRALWNEITRLKSQLHYFAHKLPNGTTSFYQEADIFDNIKNIGLKVIEDYYTSMTEQRFRIEVLNEHVKKLEGGFYPNLDIDLHCYDDAVNYDYIDGFELNIKKIGERDCRWDADYDPNKRLELSCDWGGKINALLVFQSGHLLEKTIKAFFVKPPQILDDVFEEFTKYYRFHKDKHVDFWYDRTGNNTQANSKLTYAEQAAAVLRRNGWSVTLKTEGAEASHNDKYLLLNLILSEQRSDLPKWRCNYNNARELPNSMLNAPVIDKNGQFAKDKRSEQRKNVKQEEATHFSDAWDIYMCGKYLHKINNTSTSIGLLISG